MIEVLHYLVRRRFQLNKIYQQSNVVEFPAARIDLDPVVVTVQVFTLALIAAQLMRAREVALDHYFKYSWHSYSSPPEPACRVLHPLTQAQRTHIRPRLLNVVQTF